MKLPAAGAPAAFALVLLCLAAPMTAAAAKGKNAALSPTLTPVPSQLPTASLPPTPPPVTIDLVVFASQDRTCSKATLVAYILTSGQCSQSPMDSSFVLATLGSGYNNVTLRTDCDSDACGAGDCATSVTASLNQCVGVTLGGSQAFVMAIAPGLSTPSPVLATTAPSTGHPSPSSPGGNSSETLPTSVSAASNTPIVVMAYPVSQGTNSTGCTGNALLALTYYSGECVNNPLDNTYEVLVDNVDGTLKYGSACTDSTCSQCANSTTVGYNQCNVLSMRGVQSAVSVNPALANAVSIELFTDSACSLSASGSSKVSLNPGSCTGSPSAVIDDYGASYMSSWIFQTADGSPSSQASFSSICSNMACLSCSSVEKVTLGKCTPFGTTKFFARLLAGSPVGLTSDASLVSTSAALTFVVFALLLTILY